VIAWHAVTPALRDGDGRVIAAMNVTVHAAETPVEVLTGEYLPLLLATAGAISAAWAACQSAPQAAARELARRADVLVQNFTR
jgi:IclR family pca regulon transcriptional regulator